MPSSTLPSTGVPHVDKVVHFFLYAVLGVLAARAVDAPGGRLRPLLLTLVAIAAFAAADEWHQTFVPGRSADVADWAADVIGASSAMLLLAARTPRHETIT